MNRTHINIGIGAVLLTGMFIGDVAFADNAKGLQSVLQENGVDKIKETFSTVSTLLVGIFTPLVAVLIKLVSSLMSDEYLLGANSTGQFAIAQLLYEVWDISRSIVNYMIMIALMFAAMMNVIPKIGEKYDVIKNYLPKIVMAAILVNMTWFGVRIVLDASEVATHVIYSLPQTVFQANKAWAEKMDPNNPDNKCEIKADAAGKVKQTGNCHPQFFLVNPTGSFTNVEKIDTEIKKADKAKVLADLKKQKEELKNTTFTSPEAKAAAEKTLDDQIAKVEKFTEDKIVNYGAITIFWDDFKYESFNEGTIAPLFAYSVMQIQNLPRIATVDMKQVGEGLNATQTVIDNGWISLMINSVIALLIMIMMLILFVMMTIVLIFRVIIIWINIMVAPFYIFSQIGLFDVFKKLEGGGKGYIGMGPFINSVFAPAIMGLPMVIGWILIMAGTNLKMFPQLNNTFILSGPLVNGVSDIHQVFYYALCIAVMWFGTTAVMKSVAGGTFFGGWIDKISGGVDNFVKGMASSPMYMQFIPIGSNNGVPQFASVDNLIGPQGMGNAATYFQRSSNTKNPFAPQTLDGLLENANTNEEVLNTRLQYAEGQAGSTVSKDAVTNEISSKKSDLENLFRDAGKNQEAIKQDINMSMPEIKKALDANVITLEQIWRQINIPTSNKIDNIPSDKLPEYNRLFNNAGSAPAQAASASPSSAAPPAQAQAATQPATPAPQGRPPAPPPQ